MCTSHGVPREHDRPSRKALCRRLQRLIRIGVHKRSRLHHAFVHLRIRLLLLKIILRVSISYPYPFT